MSSDRASRGMGTGMGVPPLPCPTGGLPYKFSEGGLLANESFSTITIMETPSTMSELISQHQFSYHKFDNF